MIRLRLFGLSRQYGDPVAPVQKAPARLGWQTWFRDLDQVAEEPLSGQELLLRAQGVWAVEPQEVASVVARHGRLAVGPQGDLLVECLDQGAAQALASELRRRFGGQVLLAP